MILRLLFGLALIGAGWAQANYGQRRFEDKRGWPYAHMRLWPRRFNRQISLGIGIAEMIFGIVLLAGTLINAVA
jgi:uncharacterized membrane protein YphA (DoxX/SURF4 family)